VEQYRLWEKGRINGVKNEVSQALTNNFPFKAAPDALFNG